MFDSILYTLMGFLTGTAFGGWAALSIWGARFGKQSLPEKGAEKGHDPTPAQIEAMPWKKRAKEYDLPFKKLVRKGLRIGALKEQGAMYERHILRFRCRASGEHVDWRWELLPNGSLYPMVDAYRAKREYTYSEFLALDMSVDPMEILRDRIDRHEGTIEANREAKEEAEAMKALNLELALKDAGL